MSLGRMLASVDLDYNIFFKTHKIDDIVPDGLLPSELVSFQSFRMRLLPQCFFSFRRVPSQFPGKTYGLT